jgi:hypothetical protein
MGEIMLRNTVSMGFTGIDEEKEQGRAEEPVPVFSRDLCYGDSIKW